MAANAEPSPLHLNCSTHPHYIDVMRDKLTVKYTGRGNHANDVGSIRTDVPAPRRRRIYYFEVTCVDAGQRGQVTVGFASHTFPLHRQPGVELK